MICSQAMIISDFQTLEAETIFEAEPEHYERTVAEIQPNTVNTYWKAQCLVAMEHVFKSSLPFPEMLKRNNVVPLTGTNPISVQKEPKIIIAFQVFIPVEKQLGHGKWQQVVRAVIVLEARPIVPV